MNNILLLAIIGVSAVVMCIQVANAQTNGSSMVDSLIENTKRNAEREQSYKSALIERMENTTCLPQTIISKGKEYPYNHYSFSISELELKLEDCVKRGIIK